MTTVLQLLALALLIGGGLWAIRFAICSAARARAGAAAAPVTRRIRRAARRVVRSARAQAAGGRFRPLNPRSRRRHGRFQAIGIRGVAPGTPPRQTGGSRGNGQVRALDKPSEPAVDWVTGRILQP